MTTRDRILQITSKLKVIDGKRAHTDTVASVLGDCVVQLGLIAVEQEKQINDLRQEVRRVGNA